MTSYMEMNTVSVNVDVDMNSSRKIRSSEQDARQNGDVISNVEQVSCQIGYSVQLKKAVAVVDEVDIFLDMGNVKSKSSCGSGSTVAEDDLNSTQVLLSASPSPSPSPLNQDLDETICMEEDEHDSGKDSGRGSTSPGAYGMDLSFQSPGSSTNSKSGGQTPESTKKMACNEDIKNHSEMFVEEGNQEHEVMRKVEKEEEYSVCPDVNAIVNLKAPFLLDNVIETDTPIDMYISCKGGKIGVHRLVLAAVSPFLARLLEEVPPGEPPCIILPDVSGKVVETMICFIYTGYMEYAEILQDEVLTLMRTLMVGLYGRFTLKKCKNKKPKEVPAPEPEPAVSSVNESNPLPIQSKSDSVQNKKAEEIIKSPTVGNSSLLKPEFKMPTPKLQRIPGICGVLRNDVHQCAFCPETRSAKSYLFRHIETSHKTSYRERPVSPEEKAELLYCSYCNKKFDTVGKAQHCLSDHGLTRCFICLGVLPQKDYLQHMLEAHSVLTKHGPLAQCRWCNISLEVSGSGLAMSRHALAKHACNSCNVVKKEVVRVEEQKKPLAPIFTSFFKKISESKNAQSTTATTSPSKTRPKRNLPSPSNMRPNKRPKLDENGKPIHLSKRTGLPIGPRKPILDPATKFNWGIKESTVEDLISSYQKGQFIENLPIVRVVVEPLKPEEMRHYLKKGKGIKEEEESPDSSHDDGFQSLLLTDTDEPPEQKSVTTRSTNNNYSSGQSDLKLLSHSDRKCTDTVMRNIQSAMKYMEKELTKVQQQDY